MADPRVERHADVLVGYSASVGEGDLVVIEGTVLAAPLVHDVYRRVLRAGGHPRTRIGIDGVGESLLALGDDEQLGWLNPALVEEIESADAFIHIDAAFNRRSKSGVDPARQALYGRSHRPLLKRSFEREAAGELRTVFTCYPTNAGAQEANMSLSDWEDFVYGAGLLDQDDPVSAWRSFGERAARLAEWLGQRHELRVVASGTDLTLGVAGRQWMAADGKLNFPDGEVYTAPIETSAEGEIAFTYPAIFQGRLVEDVRLRFSNGKVVEAGAGRGGEFLKQMLAMDEGASRAGEVAFGLNERIQRFTGDILFDEKIGGTMHLALGAGFPECGGRNESGLHWDLVCDLRDGSEVYADGELVYRNGHFLEGRF